ncbi:MAG: class I SAM-dependent methyltransferase [Nakamurella sp.]
MSEPGQPETNREPSRTAAGVAWLRAAHQLVDGQPRILDDPIAPLLLGARGRQAITDRRAELFTPGALGLRAHVLLRSRFAEDQLALAVSAGIRQYVILGAGLDTFGYRQPEWASSAEPALGIFEVDQPASQLVKRDRVAAAELTPPSNLTYAAIDFEHEPLLGGLARTGVDIHRPAFFSWLGVSMYLTREAVGAVLRAVAAFPPSTQLVFTFAQPRGAGPSLADRAAQVGEPWLSFFEPAELEQLLRDSGFTTCTFLDPTAAAEYFIGRTDSLAPPRRISIATATV